MRWFAMHESFTEKWETLFVFHARQNKSKPPNRSLASKTITSWYTTSRYSTRVECSLHCLVPISPRRKPSQIDTLAVNPVPKVYRTPKNYTSSWTPTYSIDIGIFLYKWCTSKSTKALEFNLVFVNTRALDWASQTASRRHHVQDRIG